MLFRPLHQIAYLHAFLSQTAFLLFLNTVLIRLASLSLRRVVAVRQWNVDHIDATLSQGAEFGIAELHLFGALGVGSQGPIPSASLGRRSKTSHFGEVEYSLCLGVHGAVVGTRLP